MSLAVVASVTLQPLPPRELQHAPVSLPGSQQSAWLSDVSRAMPARPWRWRLTSTSNKFWGVCVFYSFILCFCLGNIRRDGEGGSCQGSISCQHLNRICSGCSHLTHSIPCSQSIFQPFYLSLKAFNCFLSVSKLESAQVSGWRYPLGHGIVALSSWEGPYLLWCQAGLPRTVQVAHGQFQFEGSGSVKEKRHVGRLYSPSGWLSTSQKCFPNHRPGRGREKMWEEPLGTQIQPQLLL